MSSFTKQTQHPETKEWEDASWIDDFFGSHHYGVIFPSDAERAGLASFVGSNEWKARALKVAVDPDAVPLETREPAPEPEKDPLLARMDEYTDGELEISGLANQWSSLYIFLCLVILAFNIGFDIALEEGLPERLEDMYDALYLASLLGFGWYTFKSSKHMGQARGYLDCWKDFIEVSEERIAKRQAEREEVV